MHVVADRARDRDAAARNALAQHAELADEHPARGAIEAPHGVRDVDQATDGRRVARDGSPALGQDQPQHGVRARALLRANPCGREQIARAEQRPVLRAAAVVAALFARRIDAHRVFERAAARRGLPLHALPADLQLPRRAKSEMALRIDRERDSVHHRASGAERPAHARLALGRHDARFVCNAVIERGGRWRLRERARGRERRASEDGCERRAAHGFSFAIWRPASMRSAKLPGARSPTARPG